MTVDVVFVGGVLFSGKNGSAITAINSILHFNRTAAIFENKIGLNGGAMSLLSFAYINLYPESRLIFISNKAIGDGGAVYSQVIADYQLLSSSACAIK